MRVLPDSNILISFLLKPDADSPVVQTVRIVMARACELLLPEELLAEVRLVVSSRKCLSSKIASEDLEELIDILSLHATRVPAIPGDIPSVTRDRKDDYLLACAVIGQADYLVTGDDDLLALDGIEETRIVTAREFCEIIQAG